LEFEGLKDALAMLMHECIRYHRRADVCELCRKNYNSGLSFLANMKEIGHSCDSDNSPPATVTRTEIGFAESDIKTNAHIASILLINKVASAKQVVELDYDKYFEANRKNLTEEIDVRFANYRGYECDPFGRKLSYAFSV
jgi:hypothetical protein